MYVADGNTIVNNRILDPTSQEKQSSRDAGIEADELRLETAACAIGGSIPAEKYIRQPVSDSYVVISQERDGTRAHYNRGELQRRDAESLSASPKLCQKRSLARLISPAS
jgi:hypothetical protein